MTRTTAHSPSLWTRRLSISKVRCPPVNSALLQPPSSPLCSHHSQSSSVNALHSAMLSICSLTPSLSLPFLPFNVLDWFALLPGDTHTLASTQSQSMLHASELFLPSSSSSEVGLTYFGKQDLFHCELNRFLWNRRSN